MNALRAARPPRHTLRLQCRFTSTASSPPLLLKIRSDLKAAMKAKDTNRLNVLRGLLAETTNLAKTSTPVQTDLQVLALLRKRAAASRAAAAEFSSAGRDDLVTKEEAQIEVLEEYAGGVETVEVEEVERVVRGVVERLRTERGRVDIGSVRKAVVGERGELHGRPVEMEVLVRIVRGVLGS